MDRTTIMLPNDLKKRAADLARKKRISLGQFIREALGKSLDMETERGPNEDPLFCDSAVFEGASPQDLSADHDAHLYGERN